MTNERELSLDDLAAMVAAGFHDVQGQVSGLRAEVGDVRGEVAGLRAEVGDVRGGVASLRTEVEQRFDRVERDLAEVKYLLTDVVRRDEFVDLKQRVETVERHLGLRS